MTAKPPTKAKPKQPRKPPPSGVLTWKQVEKLVARIEASLAPTGAVVKSPDRIASNVLTAKGKPKTREVDASIRLPVGSALILITVETRKRNSPQDVLWVEQLNTKKQSIGASATIAVSSAGFSQGAKDTAARYGILLRQLSEITPADIRGWVPPAGLTHIYRHSGPVEATIGVQQEPGDTPETTAFAPEVVAAWARDQVNAAILTDLHGRAHSINDLWLRAQAERDLFQTVPDDGSPVRRRFSLRMRRGELRIMTTSGPRDVPEITLSTELSIKREEIPLDSATIVEYASVENPDEVHQRIEFTTSGASRVNLRVGFQHAAGSGDMILTVQPITAPDAPPSQPTSASPT